MQDYHKLQVYQDAFKLSLAVREDLIDSKEYRLKEQLNGALSSIFANIAEMTGYDNKNQQRQKIIICIGESKEAESWLEYCREARIVSREKASIYIKEVIHIRMKLCGLLKSVNKDVTEQHISTTTQ